MSGSRLSPLQERILDALADVRPPWTLTGGGALVGFHLGHRSTRDLDLFWHGHSSLPDLSDLILALEAAGISVSILRRTAAFAELRASANDEVVVIDLVTDAVPQVEPPMRVDRRGASLLVDSRNEILVNKLNTLLSRSELRDLIDVRALLEAGGDLERGLAGAAAKDGSFSSATLAWVLNGLPIPALIRASGWPESDLPALLVFRDELAEQLAMLSRPPR